MADELGNNGTNAIYRIGGTEAVTYISNAGEMVRGAKI